MTSLNIIETVSRYIGPHECKWPQYYFRPYFLQSIFSLLIISHLLISGQSKAEEQPSEFVAKLMTPFKGDLNEIAERGFIRVITVHNPAIYFLDGPDQRGIAYEIMKAFEKTLNEDLETSWKKRITVAFVIVPRDQVIQALAKGQGDIAIANLTITPERKKLVDFSNPLMSDVSELIITRGKSNQMDTLADLSGLEIHVRESSSYFKTLKATNKELKKIGRPQVTIKKASEYLEDYDLLDMVNAELIPATVIDSHKMTFWEKIFSDLTAHKNIPLNLDGQIAWAMQKNTPELKATVNSFLKEYREGTLLGNILRDRYLQNNRWARRALSEEQKSKLDAFIPLFQKYGEKYELDWQLLMAQAYQESGLDQDKRSHAGAIGVMQMLPNTATDKNINIKNINKLENNIHAGAKYLSFIRNRYFSDQAINDLNQSLFSLAAYNAGPARLTRLRAKATELGLNPNIWFQNVEVAAAKEIGRETVQYVRNVFKYYVAYQTMYIKELEKQKIKKEEIQSLKSS
jgi:membrane-bound lytic murein transglycosylase MltF